MLQLLCVVVHLPKFDQTVTRGRKYVGLLLTDRVNHERVDASSVGDFIGIPQNDGILLSLIRAHLFITIIITNMTRLYTLWIDCC